MQKHSMKMALVAAVALVGLSAGVVSAQWEDPREMEIPTLNEIKVPKSDRFELKNGMVVYLLENHDFPLVDARALIRAGSIYEPADKVGLASITGNVMRTGGSSSIEGDALDERLESLGASVEISVGSTQGRATVSTLSEDLEEGLGILSDLLRNPAFPDDKIDLAKKQARTGIASRNDEPLAILQRELPKLIYGAAHPYARHTEYATIDAITRDDLVAFHRDYIHPDRIILTVHGDFNKGKVKKLLEKQFGTWARSTNPLPPDPEVSKTEVVGNFVADKKNTTNTVVVLGHEGMRMDNPDYAAMQIFHQVMGGGLGSKLFNEIRSKRGLAYATGSFSGAQLHHPGAQGFYVLTQIDSTAVTTRYLKEEIEKSLSMPFTAEELQRGKDAILNSLVFSFASEFSVLNRLAAYEFYGYPQDFLQQYQESIKKLTADDVLAAAQRNIRYPDMATIFVGESEKFSESLGPLGGYEEIDISIPEPAGEEIPEATDADFKRGQELLSAAAKATGGPALENLEDLTVVESGVLSVQGMQLNISSTSVKKFPDCEKSEQKLPMGTMVQTVCGDDAWMDMMQGAQPMPAEVKERYYAQRERDLVHLLREYPDMKLQALPAKASVEGAPAHVVFVHSESTQQWKIYIDAETKRIVRMDYRDQSPMDGAPVMAEEYMGDYREVSGVYWPHVRKVLHDGEELITLNTGSVSVNAGVAPDTFKMP